MIPQPEMLLSVHHPPVPRLGEEVLSIAYHRLIFFWWKTWTSESVILPHQLTVFSVQISLFEMSLFLHSLQGDYYRDFVNISKLVTSNENNNFLVININTPTVIRQYMAFSGLSMPLNSSTLPYLMWFMRV